MKLDKFHIILFFLTLGLGLIVAGGIFNQPPTPMSWTKLQGPFLNPQSMCQHIRKEVQTNPKIKYLWRCYIQKQQQDTPNTLFKSLSNPQSPVTQAVFFSTRSGQVQLSHHLGIQQHGEWFLLSNIAKTFIPKSHGIHQSTVITEFQQLPIPNYQSTRLKLSWYHYRHDNNMTNNQYQESESDNSVFCLIHKNKIPLCSPKFTSYAHTFLRQIDISISQTTKPYDHRLMSQVNWNGPNEFKVTTITDAKDLFKKQFRLYQGEYKLLPTSKF